MDTGNSGVSGTSGERLALVVDDVPINRRLAAAFLAKLGWEVGEAEGGSAALDWLGRHPATRLVLLDIGMPERNGEEVCLEMRKSSCSADLVVVAYTAHALPGDVERFLANGFDAVLINPISLQMVRDVVCSLFPG